MLKKVLVIVGVLVAIFAAWYLISPLFLSDEVDEAFPEISEKVAPTQGTLERFDEEMEMPTEEEIEKMTDTEKMVVETKMTQKAQKMEVVTEDDMPSGPQLLKSGAFQDADSFHKGSGDAKIYSLEDGSQILRLENFEVTNGPDLYVYLSEGTDSVKPGIELGRLKGNKGNQNYEIPAGVDINQYNSVNIYCRAFSVLFSPAVLN